MKEILKKYPNDGDLGKYIRNNKEILNSEQTHKIMCSNYPNDFELGSFFRFLVIINQ